MTAACNAKDTNHEKIFVEHYNQLLKRASQLTRGDRELAKDLVQESYLLFTLSASDLVTINNVDNYLYGVVRNAYLTHLRRNSRQQYERLTDFEFDSARDLLLADDPRRLIQIKDELRAICQHACTRKETSVTASVLILRFFHGYVPSEIAKLLHSSRNIVDVQLRSARDEVITSLSNPKSAVIMSGNSLTSKYQRRKSSLASDFLAELREEIFASKQGDCLGLNQWEDTYRTHKGVTRATLSHLVSCPRCLDDVNSILVLPPLCERNAIDVLGRANSAEGNPIKAFVIGKLSLISASSLWLLLASANDFLT